MKLDDTMLTSLGAVLTAYVAAIILSGAFVRALLPNEVRRPWREVLGNRRAAGGLVIVASSILAAIGLISLSSGTRDPGYWKSLAWTIKVFTPPLVFFLGWLGWLRIKRPELFESRTADGANASRTGISRRAIRVLALLAGISFCLSYLWAGPVRQ